MSVTRTGGFTIGFRRGFGQWMKGDIEPVIRFAKENEFGAIDLGKDGDTVGKAVIDAGLRVGSVDLLEWQGMLSADAGKRREAVEKNKSYVEACAKAIGPVNHFTVMLPEDPARDRAENFKSMVESFSELAPAMEKAQAKLVIEGWPGPGALCCTPETVRPFFKEVPSRAMGFNYDPSHLIRMGVDPLRFLREFAERVYHIHGKDTELTDEGLYECGNLQPGVFNKAPFFGGHNWRYTIPGHGCMRWTTAFEILAAQGYKGCVCIELEDVHFNGKEEGEKLGYILGRKFLEGA